MSSLNKIDPSIISKVSSLENREDILECVVYVNSYKKVKDKFLDKYNVVFEYPFINAFGLKLKKEDILNIAKYSCVSYITQESTVFAQINVSKKIMQVDKFYENNIYGKDITIAVIDTGISKHLDFCFPKNKIKKFVDLINNREEPYDDNGHGTFVTGIACGTGISSGFKYSGVAPKANIVSIKALEENGETGTFKILEAMQWIYDNHKRYNIKVVCMSFGSPPTNANDPMMLGAEALWNNGIVVVAAAGNSGPETKTIKSPGVSGKIITVGGFDDRREGESYDEKSYVVASFSSRGPAGYFYKPDVVAPAVNIMGINNKGGYSRMSGTSVATPMVAGIATLILEKNPTFTPNQVKSLIIKNCKKISNNKNNDGFGYINLKDLKIW